MSEPVSAWASCVASITFRRSALVLGKFVRSISVPSWASIFATFSSAPAAMQSVRITPRRIGPCASWVE